MKKYNYIILANSDIFGWKVDSENITAHISAQTVYPKTKKIHLPMDFEKFTPYFGKMT